MRRFFNYWSWSLANLFSSTAVAVTLFGAVNAGAGIVMPANSNVQPTSNIPAGIELPVDGIEYFAIYPDLNTENADRPALPPLLPDEPQASKASVSTGDAVPSTTTPNNNATVETNDAVPTPAAPSNDATTDTKDNTSGEIDNAAPDASSSTTDNFSDYYRFKFGHFGGYYGENADASSPADMSANDTAANNSSGNSNNENQSGDSKATNDESTNNGAGNSAVPAADKNSSDASKIESDPNSDTTDKSSDDSNYSRPENFSQDWMKYKYGHSDDYYGG
ncbi:MAG: hypothetical protein ABSG53_09550, partial [Thermoguttaceae bacterium]